MTVELKPCGDTFIEFCVASEYSEEDKSAGELDIEKCVGKSDALSGGKKSASFLVDQPMYYVYVYRGAVG